MLEECWVHLCLSEEEQVGITRREETTVEENIKEQSGLVGKIYTERTISRDMI